MFWKLLKIPSKDSRRESIVGKFKDGKHAVYQKLTPSQILLGEYWDIFRKSIFQNIRDSWLSEDKRRILNDDIIL